MKGSLPQHATATLGVDFHSKLVTIESEHYNNKLAQIKLSFFDTAGEEKYHAVTACHYRNAKGTIIVYDVTSR